MPQFEIRKGTALAVGAAGLALAVATIQALVKRDVLDKSGVDEIVHFTLEYLRAQPDQDIRGGEQVIDKLFTEKFIDQFVADAKAEE